MSYKVQVDQISTAGFANGRLALYEAHTKLEAIALATYEVDIGRSLPQRIATVFDPSGLLVLAYIGRARTATGDERR